MPFYKIQTLKNQKKYECIPLQAQRLNRDKIHHYKRAPVCTSFVNGNITLEAAITLPIFLFAILMIVFFCIVFSTNLKVYTAMENVSDSISKTVALSDKAKSTLGSDAFIKASLVSEIGTDAIANSGIINGVLGISVSKSEFREDTGILDIVVTYKMAPNIASPLLKIKQTLRLRRKCFLGNDLNMTENTLVYVTENGVVYHTKRKCTYLNLDIKSVNLISIETQRNDAGCKYSQCKLCKKTGSKGTTSQVYVTGDGDKYHYSLSCQGLKRQVYMKELSDVGDLTPCSRCGNY